MTEVTLVLLPGDGIGPEVVAEAVKVLDAVAEKYGHTFHYTEHLVGGCSIDAHGTALTDEVLAACKAADAVLLGAVGGPKWSDPSAPVRPEQGLLKLRKEMGLFANLRPVKIFPELAGASPLKLDRLEGVDVLFVRELTGGIYFGESGTKEVEGETASYDTMQYSVSEVTRVVRLACGLAMQRGGKVTSVDKANVLESSRLWRQVAEETVSAFPGIELEHQLVDSMAMRLITGPASLDVVVTSNMFGDILTDEASVLGGSLGMLPSASLGEDGKPGLYEPIHGSAPDIAGKGLANPLGTILSAAMLLRWSLAMPDEAAAIEAAVEQVLADGLRTADLDRENAISTSEMGDAVVARLK